MPALARFQLLRLKASPIRLVLMCSEGVAATSTDARTGGRGHPSSPQLCLPHIYATPRALNAALQPSSAVLTCPKRCAGSRH